MKNIRKLQEFRRAIARCNGRSKACNHVVAASNFGQPHNAKLLKVNSNFSNGLCTLQAKNFVVKECHLYAKAKIAGSLPCVHFFLHQWMTVSSKCTQCMNQKPAMGNNGYLLLFPCPQPDK
jgi:hypothetical protein